jgi:HEPN domain-containing protein
MNEKQIAALQAVKDATCGCQFASVQNVAKTVKQMQFRALHDEYGEVPELNSLLDELEGEYLIERKEIKGKPYVGLTEDGERCNHLKG